jgi:hypothetical protein
MNQKSILNEPDSTLQATKLTYSFGKCKICEDFATGIHYGIPTCEGCKV